MERKGQGLSINVIIIIAIALIVFVLLVLVVSGRFSLFRSGLDSCGNNLCTDSPSECTSGTTPVAMDCMADGTPGQTDGVLDYCCRPAS